MPVISPDTCAAAAVSLGVDPAVAHRAAPLLARFVDELHRGNDRFGLIGREDAAEAGGVPHIRWPVDGLT